MELCKEYKSLNSTVEKEVLCESFELDLQENLPQYLDDIERIIKCSVKCVVTDYECTGGAIKLYGKSIISLTYLNSDGCPLSNIFEEEFSKPINTTANCDVNFAEIKLITKYSNYRLINQRRIDIHISLRANITAFCVENEKSLLNCKNAFVKEYNPSRLCEKGSGICSEDFDETFTISDTNSQIKNIINTFSNCIIEDKKIIKDKMLVKLKLELSVLFENENNDIEKAVHTFSLSKIIDVNDAGEDDCTFVNATVSSLYVKTKADSSNRLCDIEVVGKVTFSYKLYCVCNEEFIVDSYMTNYNTELEKRNVRIKSNPIYYYDDRSDELSFDIDRNIIEILDLKTSIVDSYVENSVMILTVKLSCLYFDDSSQLCYYENTIENKSSLNDIEMSGVCSANIISFDYVIKNANSISLRINYEYNAYLYSGEDISIITDINTSTEKENFNLPQLTLYFAQKDENVWDIAKKFSTAMSLIMDENDLTSQVIDGQRVLLVPGM